MIEYRATDTKKVVALCVPIRNILQDILSRKRKAEKEEAQVYLLGEVRVKT